MDLQIKVYNDKSFVVCGNDTRQVKEDLKNMGGKWNSNLTTGAGWIFSNKQKETVEKWLLHLDFDIAPKTTLLSNPKSKLKSSSFLSQPTTSFIDEFLNEYLHYVKNLTDIDIGFIEPKDSFLSFYQLDEDPRIELTKIFFDFLSSREGNFSFHDYKIIFDNYENITKILLIELSKQ